MPRALSRRPSWRTSTESTRCWMKYEVETPEHGHEHGAGEGFGQDGGMGTEQAEEATPGADRRVAPRGGSRSGLGHDQQQVAGPAPAELVAGQRLDPARRVGHDDRALADAVEDDEVAEALLGLHVGDGGQGDLGQGLERALDGLGGEARAPRRPGGARGGWCRCGRCRRGRASASRPMGRR